MKKIARRATATGCVSLLMTVTFVPPAAGFELHAPPASCEGHEYLTKQAATKAGVDGNGGYLPSFEYGVRYVDLSGMKIATGWVSGKATDGFNATQGGGIFAAKSPISNPVAFIHENETTQHHHFCLRGGASDFKSLVMDTAAWIRKMFLSALKTPATSKQSVKNGGLLVSTQESVYTRQFLLGAAAHALQDSFAHGKRAPVYGTVNIAYKVGHTGLGRPESLLKQFGGPDGKHFRDKGLYTAIEAAVLYPKHAAGTKEHNYVYKDWQGQNFQSDKIWNGTVCVATPTHLGSLQPHAFAAYLATKDLFEAFKRAEAGEDADAELRAFFQTWFRAAGQGLFQTADGAAFPGYGDPMGKCSAAGFGECQYFYIAGEQPIASLAPGAGAHGPTIPLKLFWGGKQQDNFVTATGAGAGDALAAGYALTRIEARILATQTLGVATRPLKTYWGKGKDNMATATDAGEGAAKQAGYSFVRTEGYVYETPQPNTIPLKLYWSQARGDNMTLANAKSEAAAIDAGYKFVRVEGYVLPP